MIGTGSWVATRNAKSAQLFIDEFAMNAKRQTDSLRRHDEFMRRVWTRIVRFFRRFA